MIPFLLLKTVIKGTAIDKANIKHETNSYKSVLNFNEHELYKSSERQITNGFVSSKFVRLHKIDELIIRPTDAENTFIRIITKSKMISYL